MKSIITAFWCAFLWSTTLLCAQDGIEHPDQFYTNGVQIDGWTRNDQQQLMSSFWFAKNPANSNAYQQQLAIIYDNRPNEVYYYDLVSRRFVGRYDLESEMYSLLPEQFRLPRLRDIREDMFPEPGEKPSVGEMFQQPANGLPNAEQLMMPPASMMFPRLTESTWDAHYTTDDRRRIRVEVKLHGNQGTYNNEDWQEPGRLTDVRYNQQENMHMISGRWRLGGGNGFFVFRIPMDDLNVFEGEWGRSRGAVAGIWDGKRTSR